MYLFPPSVLLITQIPDKRDTSVFLHRRQQSPSTHISTNKERISRENAEYIRVARRDETGRIENAFFGLDLRGNGLGIALLREEVSTMRESPQAKTSAPATSSRYIKAAGTPPFFPDESQPKNKKTNRKA
jgi:hypothetical protein